MRVFLCSYSGFSLAVPMQSVLSIFLVREEPAEKKTAYKTENSCLHISLPELFKNPDSKIHHGIIINNEDNRNGVIKNILLSTEIQSESDIPCGKFYPIPKTLGGFRFSQFFNGIHFNSPKDGADMTLLLDPFKLILKVEKEFLS